MNNISGACKLIKFYFDRTIPEDLSNFFDEYFDVTAINYTDYGQEEVVGYMPVDFEERNMLEKAELSGIKLPPYKIQLLESKNWLTENVIKFSPFETGNFLIYGSHEKNNPKTSKLPVMVYAATAFGSEHKTTKMCLDAISFLYDNNYQCRNILDIGTGSGILSIAAAKQWDFSSVIAVDIDNEAVEVCKKNSADNALNERISCLLGDGYKLTEITRKAPYDLIMANIFARPLIAMSKDMYQNLKKGGFGIISGFIKDQEEWVLKEHEKLGFKTIKTFEEENWCAAILEKNK